MRWRQIRVPTHQPAPWAAFGRPPGMEPFSLFRGGPARVGRPCPRATASARALKAWFEESGRGRRAVPTVDESAREIEVDHARFCAAIGAVVSDFDATPRAADSVLAQPRRGDARAPRDRRPRRGREPARRRGRAGRRRRRGRRAAAARGGSNGGSRACGSRASRRSSGSATSAPNSSGSLPVLHGRAHVVGAAATVRGTRATLRRGGALRFDGKVTTRASLLGPCRSRLFELLRARATSATCRGELQEDDTADASARAAHA